MQPKRHLLPIFTCFVSLLAVLTLFALPVEAIDPPLEVNNNKFGIHITDVNDLPAAANLVNSNGGDWGYVTFVIRRNQMESVYWQEFFDQLRRLHLIPIVRLATSDQSGIWSKPDPAEFDSWAEFLDSLNWVIKNRYVILFNEPNHAKEWGGQIDPVEYADYSLQLATKLKNTSSDFFVLPAGIDLSASNTSNTMHPADFYGQIFKSRPQYFTSFHGWTSHAYPNPNFSASPFNTGRNSISGYLYEQNLLAQYGIPSDIPIFITETGWLHHQGVVTNTSYLSTAQVANFFKQAFDQIWVQSNIVAVTPFILNYQTPPFDHFSFLQVNTLNPHPAYDTIQDLSKPAGRPVQLHDSLLLKNPIPSKIPQDTKLRFALTFQNQGQSIWDSDSTALIISSSTSSALASASAVPYTEPGQQAKIWVSLDSSGLSGTYLIQFQLEQHQLPFGQISTAKIDIASPVNLLAQVRFWIHSLFNHRDIIVAILSFRHAFG